MVKIDGSKRRWYKRHLRTWLIPAVVLLPVILCAVAAHRVWTQRAAVAQIKELGGQVAYDTNLSELSDTSRLLKYLFGIDAIASVRSVNLWGPAFGDTEVECLKPFARIQSLSLDSAAITDSGLRHLKGCKSLKKLDLRNTNIGDEGLRHLQPLAALHDLNLSNTKVTDAGLKHLVGLATLSDLWLAKTKVTDAGVSGLQKSLPKCNVKR